MSFDEEYLDDHHECRNEIERLAGEVQQLERTNDHLRKRLEAVRDMIIVLPHWREGSPETSQRLKQQAAEIQAELDKEREGEL